MADRTHGRRLEYHASQYLLFQLRDSTYAVPVASVNEIVLLPELMPIDERPPHFVGVVDLRGAIVPVIDLAKRLGRPVSSYSVDDYLLVLEHAGQQVALIANDTRGVHSLATSPERAADSTAEPAEACVSQVVTIDDKIVMVLDLNQVLSSCNQSDVASGTGAERVSVEFASEDERELLRRRAEHLRQSGSSTEADQLSPFAVAEIDGEFFGFDLRHVREFCEPRQIAHVPCCPEHIVGNVNVRGDVLTVIDIRRELNLPRRDWGAGAKIIVARTAEMTVGLMVDELHGVVYRLTAGDVDNLGGSPSVSPPVVAGTSQFGDGVMCLLNLPVLLELNRWVVDDEVPHV